MKSKAQFSIPNYKKSHHTQEPLTLAEMDDLIGGKTSNVSFHNSDISIQNRMFERHELAVAGSAANNITFTTIGYPHEHQNPG